jgi:DNA end-binding protein Ku
MARAVWTGTISFGLVSVPVRLYPATRRKDVRFHEIDRSSGQRIRHQRVVEPAPFRPPVESGRSARGVSMPEPFGVDFAAPAAVRSTRPLPPAAQPVAAADILKGFEVAKDRYVTVDRGELEELAPERSRAIDVEQFVESSAIDPIYYDVSYYAVPERDHERAFGLLVDAMRETKRIAICWFVLRRKRYLAALRPHGRLIVLSTLFHVDEILPASELEPSAPQDLRKKEREMAALLITTLSGPFEPERYPDQYRQRLKALIEGRAASARPAAPEVLSGAGVQDLMAALQASVEQARRASKARPRPTARRKRKTA